MIVSILIGLVPVLGILVLILHPPKKTDKRRRSRAQFNVNGKAAGFSPEEIDELRTIALQAGIKDYASLFQSPEKMEICMHSLLRTIRTGGDDPVKQDFLARLYEYRKKIEMGGPKQGVTGSHEIGEGQELRVVLNNSEIYQSRVLKNNPGYLLISRPVSPKGAVTFSWARQRLSLYFWKEGDAGYVFDCVVLDEVYLRGISALKVCHSDSLLRTQRRKSIRIKTHKPAFLTILDDKTVSDTPKPLPEGQCFIEDLSNAGCGVSIDGKAARGMRVKLQFALDDKPLTMTGTVRAVEYTGEANRSMLHVAADPLGQEAKDAIFKEIFGILPGDENFLQIW
jgi:c-di-GMP-binding flagellar brake protein YcgR